MNVHEHDDHLADHIHASYDGTQTTGAAHRRIDQLERSLGNLWERVFWLSVAGGTGFVVALAGVLWLAATR